MDHDQLINTVGILLITIAIIWTLTRYVHKNTRQSVTDRQTREDDQEEMKKYIRNIRSIPPTMPMTQERKLQLQKLYLQGNDHDIDHSTKAATEAEPPQWGETGRWYTSLEAAVRERERDGRDLNILLEDTGIGVRWRLVPRNTEVEHAREGSQPGVDTIVTNQSTI